MSPDITCSSPPIITMGYVKFRNPLCFVGEDIVGGHWLGCCVAAVGEQRCCRERGKNLWRPRADGTLSESAALASRRGACGPCGRVGCPGDTSGTHRGINRVKMEDQLISLSRSGWWSKSRNRLRTACPGLTSPRSYLEKALCPPRQFSQPRVGSASTFYESAPTPPPLPHPRHPEMTPRRLLPARRDRTFRRRNDRKMRPSRCSYRFAPGIPRISLVDCLATCL